MREIGPVGKRGEQGSIGFGRTLLGIVKSRMQAFGFNHAVSRKIFPRGNSISVLHSFGKDFVYLSGEAHKKIISLSRWLFAVPYSWIEWTNGTDSGKARTGFFSSTKSSPFSRARKGVRFFPEVSKEARVGLRDYTDEDFILEWKCSSSDRMVRTHDYIAGSDNVILSTDFCSSENLYMDGHLLASMPGIVCGAGILRLAVGGGSRLFLAVVTSSSPVAPSCGSSTPTFDYKLYFAPIGKRRRPGWRPLFADPLSFSIAVGGKPTPQEDYLTNWPWFGQFVSPRFIFSPQRDKFCVAFKHRYPSDGPYFLRVLEWEPQLTLDGNDFVFSLPSPSVIEFEDTVTKNTTSAWQTSQELEVDYTVREVFDDHFCDWFSRIAYGWCWGQYFHWERVECTETVTQENTQTETETESETTETQMVESGRKHLAVDYSMEGALLVSALDGTIQQGCTYSYDYLRELSCFQSVSDMDDGINGIFIHSEYYNRSERIKTDTVDKRTGNWELNFIVLSGGAQIFSRPLLKGTQNGITGELLSCRVVFCDARENVVHGCFLENTITWQKQGEFLCPSEGSYTFVHFAGLNEVEASPVTGACDDFFEPRVVQCVGDFWCSPFVCDYELHEDDTTTASGDEIETPLCGTLSLPARRYVWLHGQESCTTCDANQDPLCTENGLGIDGQRILSDEYNSAHDSSSSEASESQECEEAEISSFAGVFHEMYPTGPGAETSVLYDLGEGRISLNFFGRGSAGRLSNASLVSTFYPVHVGSPSPSWTFKKNAEISSGYNPESAFFDLLVEWNLFLQDFPEEQLQRNIANIHDVGFTTEDFPRISPSIFNMETVDGMARAS